LVSARVEGDASVLINEVAKLEEGQAGSLGFLSNPKYESWVYQTACSAILVPESFQPSQTVSAVLLRHPNPYFAFCKVLTQHFNPITHPVGVASTADIAEGVQIPDSVYIGHGCTISSGVVLAHGVKIYPGVFVGEGVSIGADSVLFPNVTLYPFTQLGQRVTVHAGSVIGSDGFGYAMDAGRYHKIPQVGIVVLEDDVEVGANCTIDRATMGRTLISLGSKLDNSVQIGHNVVIGKHTVIAAQAGIAGSTKIGEYSVLGGQSGVSGHLVVPAQTQLGGQAGLTRNLEKPGLKLSGTPALPVQEYLRSSIAISQLSDLQKQVRALQKEVQKLKENTPSNDGD
jgi:UDP-3-O-[3-hydroxymyristoyl] glucosamine N-acyltransferase